MLKLNVNKENGKYKNLFSQGIEFVYENEDIPANVEDTEATETKEEVKEDKKKKQIKRRSLNHILENIE